MTPSVLYHCTCTSASTSANYPPAHTSASSSYAFHPLHTLFFCEECDLVRCNRCVRVEVSCYYCPNCLFEVPTASVRGENNRCARNCFQCPHCCNTLSVVPSDPPEYALQQPQQPSLDSIGDPPFFLYCNYCRWDSAEVGITFDKPTGLAQQLQKLEDSLPDSLEFERLKEHFEPLIRASSSALHSSTSHPAPSTSHRSSATAAAASALARDIPGLRTSTRAATGRTLSNPKNPGSMANRGDIWDNAVYKSRLEASSGVGMTMENDIEWLKNLDEVSGLEEVADLDKRWLSSWTQSMRATELRPLRMPLHSKKTKRCYSCTHILIKPEQKAQSVRYKIKLMAANYLPAMDIFLPSALPTSSALASTKSKIKTEEDNKATNAYLMQPGKMYPFHLTLTNPLYEPIQVKLTVHRAPPPLPSSSSADSAPYRPPFAVTLPSAAFPISAFAEAWEYEDDDEMFDEDDLEEMLSGGSGAGGGGDAGRRRSTKTNAKAHVGVLERKANTTKIGGEVLISREGSGEVKFNVLVSYTYRADDPSASDELSKSALKKDGGALGGATKTFSFFALVSLGTIGPKEDGTTRMLRKGSVSSFAGGQ